MEFNYPRPDDYLYEEAFKIIKEVEENSILVENFNPIEIYSLKEGEERQKLNFKREKDIITVLLIIMKNLGANAFEMSNVVKYAMVVESARKGANLDIDKSLVQLSVERIKEKYFYMAALRMTALPTM